jgi:hypothetical protein
MLSLAKAFFGVEGPQQCLSSATKPEGILPTHLASRENALTSHCHPKFCRDPSTTFFAHSAEINSAQDDNSI